MNKASQTASGEKQPAVKTADSGLRSSGQLLQTLGPLLALVIVALGFTVADRIYGQGKFSEMRNIRVVLTVSAPVAVAACGMTLVIIAGGIDLSAGTAAMLCATVLACALRSEYPVALAVAMALLTGAGCGLINGLLIGTLKIPPFIVTLGTMTIFLGLGKRLAHDWAGATTVTVNREMIPAWLLNLTSTMPPDWNRWLPNIAAGVWLALAIAAMVAALLRYTVFGRHLYALGSSEATARLCGVNILATKVWVYVVAGLLLGVAGIYSFSLVKSATPIEGIGKELKYIAAVVIGGASLSGGRGSVLGTLAGAAIMGVITSGCDQLGIENSTQDMIIGVIIIAAVTLDRFRQRRQES